MTIINYIVRMLVAVVLGISFLVTWFMCYEALWWEVKLDLAGYISLVVFIIFAYLLWIIK